MPSRAKGPRLWLRKARRDKRGTVTHPAVWLILDGRRQESTECGPDDCVGAERALEQYLNRKHVAATAKGVRDPSQIYVADVLALYSVTVIPKHARPKESLQRVSRLLEFFDGKRLSDINGDLCREFVKVRSTLTAARDDLSLLRAAINFHREEGHCEKIVSVVLPEKPVGRERWATRGESRKAFVGRLAVSRNAEGQAY
jgi:hypothetical protein